MVDVIFCCCLVLDGIESLGRAQISSLVDGVRIRVWSQLNYSIWLACLNEVLRLRFVCFLRLVRVVGGSHSVGAGSNIGEIDGVDLVLLFFAIQEVGRLVEGKRFRRKGSRAARPRSYRCWSARLFVKGIVVDKSMLRLRWLKANIWKLKEIEKVRNLPQGVFAASPSVRSILHLVTPGPIQQ